MKLRGAGAEVLKRSAVQLESAVCARDSTVTFRRVRYLEWRSMIVTVFSILV